MLQAKNTESSTWIGLKEKMMLFFLLMTKQQSTKAEINTSAVQLPSVKQCFSSSILKKNINQKGKLLIPNQNLDRK